MLKAPKFWYERPGFLSWALSPLGFIYGIIEAGLGILRHPEKCELPVISIGNLVMGGSGKTPTTIALVALLKEIGHTPHIITRGYGGKARGPIRVDPKIHAYHEVGDEPLLLAKAAPTWVDHLRVNAARLAKEEGATILLLDDAHQNRKLKKDLSLIVVDGKQKFGNGFVFPSGPLREFFGRGMARAEGIIWVSKENENFSKPTFHAKLKPQYEVSLKNSPLIAFSGLGFNQKFLATLKEEGFQVLYFKEFPDHHPYHEKDLEHLLNFAHNKGAKLVTTAKDEVRLPESYRNQLDIINVGIEFENPEELKSWLVSQNLH
ncbi:Tetraacyldisaccharide 4'-kinase [Candidatus Bealeia paramacronuclearis]|uniref:Tetraacyldisaccharide 4'-kinase n=1 Tax=Candidatus Bealeia paramacronuclearis TaxID=1921001 RepID=A0ABZ2C2G8_9PROT|nr:Tetraacyldisaccharide 4'-kinase [Candidatus Bealeia paramacronuclearis]